MLLPSLPYIFFLIFDFDWSSVFWFILFWLWLIKCILIYTYLTLSEIEILLLWIISINNCEKFNKKDKLRPKKIQKLKYRFKPPKPNRLNRSFYDLVWLSFTHKTKPNDLVFSRTEVSDLVLVLCLKPFKLIGEHLYNTLNHLKIPITDMCVHHTKPFRLPNNNYKCSSFEVIANLWGLDSYQQHSWGRCRLEDDAKPNFHPKDIDPTWRIWRRAKPIEQWHNASFACQLEDGPKLNP